MSRTFTSPLQENRLSIRANAGQKTVLVRMSKRQFSLGSLVVVLLTTLSTLFAFDIGCAQADIAPSSDVAPISKTSSNPDSQPQSVDYPKRADGKFDWRAVVAAEKPRVVSQRLIEDFATMEAMQQNISTGAVPLFKRIDLFDLNDIGNSSNPAVAKKMYDYKVAVMMGVQYGRAMMSKNDRFFETHEIYDQFAVDCMVVAITAKNRTLREFAAAMVEDKIAYVYELINNTQRSGSDPFLPNSNNRDADDALRSGGRVVQSYADILYPTVYTQELRSRRAELTCENIDNAKNLNEYIEFLRSDNLEMSKIKARIIQSAQAEISSKPELR